MNGTTKEEYSDTSLKKLLAKLIEWAESGGYGSGNINRLVSLMIECCTVWDLGYDQSNRLDIRDGGECDCSSLVAYCLINSGFNVDKDSYTGNLGSQLENCGWVNMGPTSKVKPLVAGDILLNPDKHVGVWTGTGVAQASQDENGGIKYGQSGDKTGYETWITNGLTSQFKEVWRYPNQVDKATEENNVEENTDIAGNYLSKILTDICNYSNVDYNWQEHKTESLSKILTNIAENIISLFFGSGEGGIVCGARVAIFPNPGFMWPLYKDNSGTKMASNSIVPTYAGHEGVDLSSGNCYGSPIYASASGTVSIVQTGRSNAQGSSGMESYGNCVFIDHDNNLRNYQTRYAHMSSVAVKKGEYVSRGQLIGYIGNSGNSYGAHLHFTIIGNNYYYLHADHSVVNKWWRDATATEWATIEEKNSTVGTTVRIPNNISQTGITKNYTANYYTRGWARGTNQFAVWAKAIERGRNSSYEVATINERYLVAVSETFGSVGDCININLENGIVIKAIIADVKSTRDSNYSAYGHLLNGKADVIEWEGIYGHPPHIPSDWVGKKVVSITNTNKRVI